MHPTGIEPALKASEAFVLSIRLRMQMLQIYYITLTIITQIFLSVYILLLEIFIFIENFRFLKENIRFYRTSMTFPVTASYLYA